ncbi:MAG: malate dehydrogenase [Flavobacteriales bacterium]|nr:Ldh family oxidoreductase [Flavobacteriaceae bacterium]PHX92272.1 MAG: malate dehydrogenase [Flavobacteriales bacterium]
MGFTRIKADFLKDWVETILVQEGFSQEHANLSADVLLMADLRGIDSHGVARLEGYIRLIRSGQINPKPNMVFTQRKKSMGLLNADSAIGLVSAPLAMLKAIEMGKEVGSGWVGISNSNHFGIAAYHAMLALEHSMIGLAMTNASPLVTPAGGSERMLGTNPLCICIPAAEELPFVLDMATSAAANGKLEIADRLGKSIPRGWALDNSGGETNDPTILKQGGMLLPLGSDSEHGAHKGFGLGAWVDIFSGVLSGANYGPWVPPFVQFLHAQNDQPGLGIGHFVGCWELDGFRDIQAVKKDMDQWIRRFKTTVPASGIERVMIPGEPEYFEHKKRASLGIPIENSLLQHLKLISDQYSIPFNP